MARIIFYEKPGCSGNAKQRAWLEAAGHTLVVRDLAAWPWTRESLLEYLAPLPVTEWFNSAARKIRSSEIVPSQLNATSAVALLLADPLLIRRPLMSLEDGTRLVGFDEATVNARLALPGQTAAPAEGCAHPAVPCPPRPT